MRNSFWLVLGLLACSPLCAAGARVLAVGPGKPFSTPAQAAVVAQDGDVIEIAAGDYSGGAAVAVWRANNLTLRGVGGRPRLAANGQSAEQKAIWVIKGRNTTVEDLEFTGCQVPDRNGAGIRQEGPGLTVRRCWFHGNQDGVLTGAHPESDILFESCEFDHNGAGDGLSHNIYIGRVRSFILRYCSSHHAQIGHLVKSRAETNYLLYNRLMDEADGTSSYVIDLPNGGRSFLIGNLIQHGPRAENGIAVSYAEEGAVNAMQELYVVNNTVVNEHKPGRFLRTAGPNPVVQVINNLIAGTEQLLTGDGTLRRNLVVDPKSFADPAHYDYRLLPGSPAIGAAVDPGKAGDVSLRPAFQYAATCTGTERLKTEKLDAGALAYVAGEQ